MSNTSQLSPDIRAILAALESSRQPAPERWLEIVSELTALRAEEQRQFLLSELDLSGSDHRAAEQLLRRCEECELSLVCLGEEGYPASLQHIPDSPLVLFVRGAVEALTSSRLTVAIVGSRKADIAGCRLAEQASREIASSGACVVSGLALGIDGAAHSGALRSGRQGATVAVLGNGLGSVYPRRHLKLAERILENNGAIVSIFPPDEPPFPYNFLNRNRIIAGLSRGVVVVQAAKRSGALSTARHALEQGREVMAFPGDVQSERYAGSLALIRNGARLVRSVSDIAEELGAELCAHASGASGRTLLYGGISSSARSVVELLSHHPCASFSQIEESYRGKVDLFPLLFQLEADGIIERLPGNRFALST